MTNESKNRSIIVTLVLLIVVAALYRVIPGRTMGFSPHLAMALFAGAVVKDKKWAFALPIFSIFLSDLLYHTMFLAGRSELPGFYAGQITNYILLAVMTSIGFLMKKINIVNIIAFSLIVCTAFFLLSNFFVWQSGAGYIRPKTFDGLMQCYADGVPFFVNSLKGTLVFAAILFGAYRLSGSKIKASLSKAKN